MLIGSRTVVGAAGAFALVGAALWLSTFVLSRPESNTASVEVQQVHERAWAVEVKEMSYQPPAAEVTKTAAVTR
ncbi:MAG TPA: hypothetical protein VGN07_15650 [Steroidobacteraceae bacterium]|jgi:hypothetical protein